VYCSELTRSAARHKKDQNATLIPPRGPLIITKVT
jgi:hypothetical protein